MAVVTMLAARSASCCSAVAVSARRSASNQASLALALMASPPPMLPMFTLHLAPGTVSSAMRAAAAAAACTALGAPDRSQACPPGPR